jgi:hypothetical protein
MYNYNFISNSDGFISNNPNVRNVPNKCELKKNNVPEPTYYANSVLSSCKCLVRRPIGIGKIDKNK